MGRSNSTSKSPRWAASRAIASLRALADPETAARGRSFFKKGDDVTLFGVRAQEMRTVARDIHDQVKQSWEVTEATAFAEILAPRRHFEAKMVGILVLGRYERQFPRSLLTRTRRWIDAGWFRNWAAIDGLCPAVTTPLIREYPGLVPRVTRWGSSRNHWLRRASVVTLVPFARRGECLDEAYGLVASLLDDAEDLMHKACGWLLREAGKTDMKRLERFLLAHGPTVPRTTVRYAIERFPETRRRRLLVRTRD
jgi:3-methyladenine DNA glycosylase AlkD